MVEQARERSDVQLAAHVEDWGAVDAVTFLRGSDIEQAVWLASAGLRSQWAKEARDRAAGTRSGSDDDE